MQRRRRSLARRGRSIAGGVQSRLASREFAGPALVAGGLWVAGPGDLHRAFVCGQLLVKVLAHGDEPICVTKDELFATDPANESLCVIIRQLPGTTGPAADT